MTLILFLTSRIFEVTGLECDPIGVIHSIVEICIWNEFAGYLVKNIMLKS